MDFFYFGILLCEDVVEISEFPFEVFPFFPELFIILLDLIDEGGHLFFVFAEHIVLLFEVIVSERQLIYLIFELSAGLIGAFTQRPIRRNQFRYLF